MADEAVHAQADYMAETLRELRSTLVTTGNKLAPYINRLEKRGIDAHDVADVADDVRFNVEDLLEYALNEIREMDEEAQELKASSVLDD
jgi:hypothetical protein